MEIIEFVFKWMRTRCNILILWAKVVHFKQPNGTQYHDSRNSSTPLFFLCIFQAYYSVKVVLDYSRHASINSLLLLGQSKIDLTECRKIPFKILYAYGSQNWRTDILSSFQEAKGGGGLGRGTNAVPIVCWPHHTYYDKVRDVATRTLRRTGVPETAENEIK